MVLGVIQLLARIIGRTSPTRSFTVNRQDAQGTRHSVSVTTSSIWVRPTGGGYFFSPSISALTILTEPYVHGVGPSPKNQRLAEAAEAYGRIAGGEAHNYGEEPLAFWRHHFKTAASSMARNFRAEWRRHLVESERDWKRRNSAHAEP
jgi:hypothetical protein